MIIVTGASRGLGRAIADRLLSNGHQVFGLARRVEGLNFPSAECDVSDWENVKAVSKEVRARGHQVKGLINAAGIAAMNLALMTPASQVENIIRVNLLGTIFCSQAFTSAMVSNKYGRVINFSTIAVGLALSGESAYVASKAGVEGFSRTFAREVESFNVTVNCVAPGPIDTDLLRGITSTQIESIVNRQVIRRQFQANDVCDVVDLLLDQKSNSISGQVFHIGGL